VLQSRVLSQGKPLKTAAPRVFRRDLLCTSALKMTSSEQIDKRIADVPLGGANFLADTASWSAKRSGKELWLVDGKYDGQRGVGYRRGIAETRLRPLSKTVFCNDFVD